MSQPSFALPAVLAAAGSDPLGAALDAVGTYGEHCAVLPAEVRSVCGG
ncbi:hypothetical protein [Streptomyces sp. NPDC014676]